MPGPVVIEGPDLAGKTCLAEALASVLGYSIHKSDADTRGTKCFQECIKIKEGEIWDRWWPSEYIYHTLFRFQERGTLIKSELLQLNKRLLDLKGCAIFLIPSDQLLVTRYLLRGDTEVKVRDLYKLRRLYLNFADQWVQTSKSPGLIIDGPIDTTTVAKFVKLVQYDHY